MGGTFGQRTRELQEHVGHGILRGSVEVNQIYAHYQHAHPEFKHPEGGKAFYLRDPLFERVEEYMKRLAKSVTGKQTTDEAMVDNMEDLSLRVFEQAPLEFGDLKASGHPVVKSDRDIVYDRAPKVRRLTEDELRAKGDVRSLFGRRLNGRTR